MRLEDSSVGRYANFCFWSRNELMGTDNAYKHMHQSASVNRCVECTCYVVSGWKWMRSVKTMDYYATNHTINPVFFMWKVPLDSYTLLPHSSVISTTNHYYYDLESSIIFTRTISDRSTSLTVSWSYHFARIFKISIFQATLVDRNEYGEDSTLIYDQILPNHINSP